MTILSILFLYFLLISQAFQFIFCHSAENTTCFMVCSMLTSSESFSVFLLSFFFFRATPTAYGGSQAMGPIGDVAASHSHSHSHSKTRSEPHLQATPPSWQCQILNPMSEARDQTCVLMDDSQICFHWATIRTPFFLVFKRQNKLDNLNQILNHRKKQIFNNHREYYFQFKNNNCRKICCVLFGNCALRTHTD